MFPYPYNTLKEVLPFNDMGWYFNEVPMEKLLNERQAKVVIELGSWLGKSTRHIASLLPHDGLLYAVDHWLGSEEHQKSSDWSKYLPTLYEQFLSNTIHAHLTHKIIPVKMNTLEASEYFRQKHIIPDLIYLDASHDEQSVYHDLNSYFPLVQGHGILCGDDWGWGLSVQNAILRFAKEKHLFLEIPNNWFWILRENHF